MERTNERHPKVFVPTWEWKLDCGDGNKRLVDMWMSETAYSDSYEAFCALRGECGRMAGDFAVRYGGELVNTVEYPKELKIVVDVRGIGRLYLECVGLSVL